jgi:hypothetical protein
MTLQDAEMGLEMSGPGGVASAHPGPNHGELSEESRTMAFLAFIPIPHVCATHPWGSE